MSEKRELMRHFLASIAYHATKAIKNAPANYPELDVGRGVRTPKHILHHITGVLSYAHSFYEHYDTTYFEHMPWEEEVRHFYETLSRLDGSFREKGPAGVRGADPPGPTVRYAMAHVGQLLMLRRLADSPVPAENFLYADIRKGVVGPDQPEPVAPDE